MPERPPRRPRFLFHWLRRTGLSLASLRKGRGERPGGRKSPSALAPAPHETTEPRAADDRAQREELLSRLVVHDEGRHLVRHLLVVHDELRRKGWTAADALPAAVLGRAVFEAELLAAEDPSPLFATVVSRLRHAHETARVREELQAFDDEGQWRAPPVAEVADSDFAEFELMERSWAGTVPAGL